MLITLAHQDPSWIVFGVAAGLVLGLAVAWAWLGRRHD